MLPHCGWCKATEGPLTKVGFDAGASGPGWTYHACTGCMTELRIVPLTRHPPHTTGAVRYWPKPVRAR